MEEEMRFVSKSKNFTHTFGVTYSKEQVMTSRKLYGKDLSEYDDVDVEDLLTQLTPEEIELLSKEVDPDDRLLPPDQRCSYECEKEATGPIDRKKLIEHINKEAIETPDRPEFQPFVPGIIRGKKWIPPQVPKAKVRDDDIGTYELGDEYEKALNHASEEELVDLAAILGFHSMMNQDQYHASLLNKEKIGLGWDGVTKASKPKPAPVDPPNMTDPEDSIKRVSDDDAKLIALNWNNLNIRDEQFERLFKALEVNTRLEILSMSNTGMTDSQAEILAQAIEKNNSLRIVNIESNLLSGKGIIRLLKAMLTMNMIEEFRASNQRAQVLGNPAEMEITQLIERNTAILRLGLHLEYNDARSRVAAQLQRNIDRKRTSVSVSVRIKTSKTTVVCEETNSASFTLGNQSEMVVIEEMEPESSVPDQAPGSGL